MPGNDFEYILGIGLDPSDYSRGLQQIVAETESAVRQLQGLAQKTSGQPGSVPVTRGGAEGDNLATQSGRLQEVAAQVASVTRELQRLGVSLDRDLVSQIERLGSGGVISDVSTALKEGPRRGPVSQFENVANQALQNQFVVAENARRNQLRSLSEYRAANQNAAGVAPPPPGAPINLSGDLLDKATEQVKTLLNQVEITGALAGRPDYIQDLAKLRLNLQRTSANVEKQLSSGEGIFENGQAYARALAETRVGQEKTNASVNQLLADQEGLGKGYAESTAANKTAQAQQKAAVEKILAADNQYIEATAGAANARKLISEKTKAAQLTGVGLEGPVSGLILPPGVEEPLIAQRRAVGLENLHQLQAENAAQTAIQKAQVDLLTARETQALDAKRSAAGETTSSELIVARKTIEAQMNVALEKALIANDVYAVATAEAATLSKTRLAQDAAAVASRLSRSVPYQTAVVDTKKSQAFTDSIVNARLSEEQGYIDSLAASKVAQQRTAAEQAKILAADQDYIESTAAAASARKLLAEESKAAQLKGVGLEGAAGVVLPPGVRLDDTDIEHRRLLGLQNLQELQAQNAADSAIAKAKQELLVAEKTQLLDVQRFMGYNQSLAEINARRLTIEAELTALEESELAGDKAYLAATAAAAAEKGRRVALEKAATEKALLADDQYIVATAEAANARRASAAFIKEKELQGAGLGVVLPPGASDKDRLAAQRAGLNTLEVLDAENLKNAELAKARVNIEQAKLAYSKEELALLGEGTAAERQIAAGQKVRAAEQGRLEYASRAPGDRGTTFQQFQSKLASRPIEGGGGATDFKDPLQYQQLGQFVKSKFLTTAGFAVSGFATYAAFSFLQNLTKDSAKLEQSLSQIRAQFEALGQGSTFAGFRSGILQISKDTGEAAGDVAQIAAQFKGAFGKTESNTQVLEQVKAAVEISRTTGLSLAEVTDSLTATALDYGTSVEHIGDVTLTLQDRTGVLASHIITAIADLAPVADSVGLRLEKIGAIAAVAQQRSGQSGASLAESLNRVLPEIQSKSGDLIQFFRQVRPDQTNQVIDALASGQTGRVFDVIGRDYASLSEAQQKYVLSLLGTRKDLKGLIPVFQNYGDVLTGTSAALDSNGRLARGYAALQGTLSQQLARAVAAIKSIGAGILSLGVSDAVQDLAKVIGLLVGILGGAVGVFADFNDALGGIPGKLIGAALAATALYKALKLLQELQIVSAISKGIAASTIIPAVLGGAGRGGVSKPGGTISGTSAIGAVYTGEVVSKSAGGFLAAIKTFGAGVAAEAGEGAGLITLAAVGLKNAFIALYAAFAELNPLLLIVPLTILALLEITSTIKGFKQARQAQKEFLGKQEQQTIPQLEAGGDQKALQDYQEQSKTLYQKRGFFGSIVGYATNPTQLFKDAGKTLAYKAPEDITAEAVRQKTSQAFARVVKSQFGDAEEKKLIDDYNKEADRHNKAIQDAALKSGQPVKQSDIKPHISEKDLADIVKKGTTNGQLFQAVINLFAAAASQRKGLGKAYQDLLGQQEKVANAQQKLTDLPTLQIEQEIGNISAKSFVSQAQSVREGLVIALQEAIKKNLPQDQIKTLKSQLDAVDQAIAQVGDKYLKDLVDARTLASSIRGDNPLQAAQSTIGANLGALRQPFALSSAQAPDLAKAVIQAQKDRLQYLIDHAKSGAAADKLLREGLKIPPEVRQALEIGQLKTALPDNVDKALRDTIVANLHKDFNTTLELIVKTKGGIKKGIENILKELADEIRHLVLIGADAAHIKAATDRYQTLLGAVQSGVFANTVPDTTKVPPPAAPTPLEANDIAASLYKSLSGGDPVKQATIELNRAKNAVRLTNPKDTKAYAAAITAVNEAQQAYTDALNATADSGLQIAAALAADDPVQAAQVAIQQADAAYAHAHSDAERNAATAQRIQGEHQLRDAIEAITVANFSVLAAFVSDDPVKAAQVAVALAQHQLGVAKNATERANALASEITAQHQLRDAINAAADAQVNLLIAIATASGDTIKAAKEGLALARRQLARDLKQGIDPKSERGRNDLANVVQAQANLRDVTLQQNEDDIQFLLDTNKISTGQAIARLRVLDANTKLTHAEHQQIEREIYSLQHQLSQDLQFNLPSDIRLPTLYEGRRFNEGGGAGAYTDNRKYDIRINTNAKLDGKDVEHLVNKIGDAISQPPRYGTRRGVY